MIADTHCETRNLLDDRNADNQSQRFVFEFKYDNVANRQVQSSPFHIEIGKVQWVKIGLDASISMKDGGFN